MVTVRADGRARRGLLDSALGAGSIDGDRDRSSDDQRISCHGDVGRAPITGTVTVPAGQTPAAAPELGPCKDNDLEVTNGPLQTANTQRRVVVSFRNTSSRGCTMVGYPGADLVTPAGGVLINVPRRPANAAHRLTLQPGDVATADVSTSAVDTATGNTCARWGQLVVTPPNDFTSHPLGIDLPICNASISSVD